MIDEVLEIQGFQIALPKQPKEIYSCSEIKSEKWCSDLFCGGIKKPIKNI